ncbi:acetyl-CoA carboxylase biotin carboxyl carrier protein subunit [Bacillus sp. T33-2]|uniref:acetyl-CoA carboxylase biotin carboxyl carrier protein subunit n=1 Tax=Bacillus sp. T33-2 TaxID=2054168 RepID=UPI000C795391|nr:acetyl-CoA carboxylase biotin carboxyl carrier protein subunit [Bacillus sp. T33-2]PLR91610.1 hypothetical protein CVD19_21760 [Bacillus sp. T33-2]
MLMKILSPMSGTVWKVLVEEGQQVAADEVLVILESMKMEIPVVAESAGTVMKIHVNEGDFLQENDPVADLEK